MRVQGAVSLTDEDRKILVVILVLLLFLSAVVSFIAYFY